MLFLSTTIKLEVSKL
ncbi:unnamed protein product [Callosobruchus maculatus]|uniref:Uncharacterized protein n=1 Tax=Callosobruchus maculatus TaxID=64391 RepID=A0A653D5B2_CALMS|nr:unnamed protein product [Callosobruchus maculatus]